MFRYFLESRYRALTPIDRGVKERPVLSLLCSILILCVPASTAFAQTFHLEDAYPDVRLSWPIEIKSIPVPGGDICVAELEGRIKMLDSSGGTATSRIFLDISDRVIRPQGESGLLGFAFHPRFEDNGRFFVSYIGKEEPLQLIISSFTADPNEILSADPESEDTLLTVDQINHGHNGGQIHFGPDGYLFVALGDGGTGGDPGQNGQDLSTLKGAILRLDVDSPTDSLAYGIPSDNPFVGDSDSTRKEIYAFGFRNPWRFSFDRETQEMWVGDVGEATWEEVNHVEKGGNYGWSRMEGSDCFEPPDNCDQAAFQSPVWQYGHHEGIAVIGGFIYRGTKHPDLRGKYVYADYNAAVLSDSEPGSYVQKIWALDPSQPDSMKVTLLSEPDVFRIVTIGELPDGELLVGALDSEDGQGFQGRVYRLVSHVSEGIDGVATLKGRISSSYPNPFTTSVLIGYTLDAPGRTTLAVYDLQGRRMRSLVNGWRSVGQHAVEWDGRTSAGRQAPQGTYFIRLTVENSLAETISVTHVK